MRYWIGSLACMLAATSGVQAQLALSPHVKAVAEVLKALEETNKVLKAVDSADTVQVAKPRLELALKRLDAARKSAAKLKQPELEERQRLVRMFAEDLGKQVRELRSQYRRLQALPEAAPLVALLRPILEPSKQKKEKPATPKKR